MDHLLFMEASKEPENYDLNIFNFKQNYVQMEKTLQETMSRLKENEESKRLLIKKNSYLVDDNRQLYDKLLNAEKGRILAEKECCELMEKMKNRVNIQDAGIQVSIIYDQERKNCETSTMDLVSDPCETCGTQKIITCIPADVLFVSREDLNSLDADMNLLKDILMKKEELYNDVIGKKNIIQEAVKELNNEIENLRNLNRWKDKALDQKEKDILDLKKVIRELKLLITDEKSPLSNVSSRSNFPALMLSKDSLDDLCDGEMKEIIFELRKQLEAHNGKETALKEKDNIAVIESNLNRKESNIVKKGSTTIKREVITPKKGNVTLRKETIKRVNVNKSKVSTQMKKDNQTLKKETQAIKTGTPGKKENTGVKNKEEIEKQGERSIDKERENLATEVNNTLDIIETELSKIDDLTSILEN